MQYNARVSLEVEQDTGFGNDTLELIIRGTSDAKSAAEAMKKVAAGIEIKVAERLGS